MSVKHVFWVLAFFCKARPPPPPPLSSSLSSSSPFPGSACSVADQLDICQPPLFPASSPYLLRTSSFLLRHLPPDAFKPADLSDLATAVRSFHDLLLSLFGNDSKKLTVILERRRQTIKQIGEGGRRRRQQVTASHSDLDGRGREAQTRATAGHTEYGDEELLLSSDADLTSSSSLGVEDNRRTHTKRVLSAESGATLLGHIDSYVRLQALLLSLLKKHLFGLHVSQRIYLLEDISSLSDIWPVHARRHSKYPELLLALQVGQQRSSSPSSRAPPHCPPRPRQEENNSSHVKWEDTQEQNRKDYDGEEVRGASASGSQQLQPPGSPPFSACQHERLPPSPTSRPHGRASSSSSSSSPPSAYTAISSYPPQGSAKEAGETEQEEEVGSIHLELPPVIVALLQSIYYRLPPLCLRTLCRLLSALHTLRFTHEGKDSPTRTRFSCSPHRKDLTWANPLLHVIGREGMRKAGPSTPEEMAEFLLRYYVDLECFDVCIEPLTFYVEK